MKQRRSFSTYTMAGVICLCSSNLAGAQSNSPATDATSVAVQIQELRTALNEVRSQLAESRRESQQLKDELQDIRARIGLPGPYALPQNDQTPQPTDAVSVLAEEQQLLKAKVNDQYQTKVESGSKYRVRLSGMVLLNVFSTRGSIDNLDLPLTATPRVPGESNGSFGASARQSLVNLEVFGPQWRGAKTSGDMSFDFFGGFPANPQGVTSGLMRLRTAKLTLEWPNTSVMTGQDTPFFSPLSPTSLASTAYPALSSAGNIWTWTPQIHVEHRISFSERAKLLLQWGILDPLTAELPAEYGRC